MVQKFLRPQDERLGREVRWLPSKEKVRDRGSGHRLYARQEQTETEASVSSLNFSTKSLSSLPTSNGIRKIKQLFTIFKLLVCKVAGYKINIQRKGGISVYQ
jgi:hypothetical protein